MTDEKIRSLVPSATLPWFACSWRALKIKGKTFEEIDAVFDSGMPPWKDGRIESRLIQLQRDIDAGVVKVVIDKDDQVKDVSYVPKLLAEPLAGRTFGYDSPARKRRSRLHVSSAISNFVREKRMPSSPLHLHRSSKDNELAAIPTCTQHLAQNPSRPSCGKSQSIHSPLAFLVQLLHRYVAVMH